MLKSVKIGVVTATRAEYGLFIPLLSALKKSDQFVLQLFVTGTHLSHEFGYTKDQILKDDFKICEEIDSLVSNDTSTAIGKTSALTLMGLVEAYERQKPDLIVLLGDRYETLSAAFAASICRIPVAHLHGGEITEGAYDDGFRHAITKLSHIHFTSTDEHRQRVVQLGEDPDLVFNVGALGIDNIRNIKPLSKKQLEEKLNIKFMKKNILVTVHPETLSVGNSGEIAETLIDSLKELKETFIILTGANADSEGRVINKKLKEYSYQSDNCFFTENLGQLNYISMLYVVDVVVGNSSSGIIEVPSFNISTINIGNRQKGRQKSKSVIDVPWDSEKILNSLNSSMSKKLKQNSNPYGDGNTAEKIINTLKGITDFKILLNKKFKNTCYVEGNK